MKLSDYQKIFAANFAKLIIYANEQEGYEIRIDEVKRTLSQQLLYYYGLCVYEINKCIPAFKEAIKATRTKQSAHLERRAGDLILDINDIYQRNTPAYKKLGDYWESLHPNNTWGGRWEDGNHFEMMKKERR